MPPPPHTLLSLKVYVAIVLCEGALWGFYSAVFGLSMYLLISKRKRTRANVFMLVISSTMYFLAIVHLGLSVVQAIGAVSGVRGSESPRHPSNYLQILFEGMNYILGDLVVIWRLWALWSNWRVCAAPVALLVGAFVSVIGGSISMSHNPDGVPIENTGAGTWGIAFAALTFSTNLCVTGLVAYRTWFHHRRVVPYLGPSTTSTRLLVFIVESGSLYCVTWVLVIILWLAHSDGYLVITSCLAQLTGIYPTLIIAATAGLANPPPLLDAMLAKYVSNHSTGRSTQHTRSEDSPPSIFLDISRAQTEYAMSPAMPLSEARLPDCRISSPTTLGRRSPERGGRDREFSEQTGTSGRRDSAWTRTSRLGSPSSPAISAVVGFGR